MCDGWHGARARWRARFHEAFLLTPRVGRCAFSCRTNVFKIITDGGVHGFLPSMEMKAMLTERLKRVTGGKTVRAGCHRAGWRAKE